MPIRPVYIHMGMLVHMDPQFDYSPFAVHPYLHPVAHESIAKLFATTSKSNCQRYIVETHSQNILLGLRDAVVDKNIDFYPEDVVIYFIDEDEEGAYMKEITIDSDGMLSSWPEGVFNESYELLKNIIKKPLRNKYDFSFGSKPDIEVESLRTGMCPHCYPQKIPTVPQRDCRYT